MSVVLKTLKNAVDERVLHNKILIDDGEMLKDRLHSNVRLIEENNDEIESLLDAIALEEDHLERADS